MIPPAEVAGAVLDFVRDESLAGQVMAVIYGQPHRLVPAPIALG